jgi:hypothetical protein
VTNRKKTVIRDELVHLWQLTKDAQSVISKVEADEPSYRVFRSMRDLALDIIQECDDYLLEEVA